MLRRIFLNIFGVSDDDKYYGGIMSRPRNYKNFEFDSGKRELRMSETETYPKAEFIRKPNLSEYRMFRSVD